MKTISYLLSNSLSGNTITSVGAKKLFETLAICKTSITKIDLSRNSLDSNCLESLGIFARDSKTLTDINLSYNKIDDYGIQFLSSSIAGNTSVRVIDFTGNEFSAQNCAEFFLKMAETTLIESLRGTRSVFEPHSIYAFPLALNKIKNGTNKLEMSGM